MVRIRRMYHGDEIHRGVWCDSPFHAISHRELPKAIQAWKDYRRDRWRRVADYQFRRSQLIAAYFGSLPGKEN